MDAGIVDEDDLALWSVVWMPRMLIRVVWGLSEVMAIFWPRIRLRRVDLPEFGRPMRAT